MFAAGFESNKSRQQILDIVLFRIQEKLNYL